MKKIAFLLILFFVMSACTEVKQVHTSTFPGNFAHTVYFWLENPDSKEDRAAFEKSLINFINASEFVVSKHIGRPAATAHRDVVDGSYTYSLLLTFNNKEDQDKYQDEAVHKQFIKESSHLWNKVTVYDSENILE